MTYVYYSAAAPDRTADYLMPAVFSALEWFPPPRPLFELGCGNGANAKMLAKRGYSVTAIDPSGSGIKHAKDGISRFEVGSTDDELAAKYGRFDVVVSLEVVEHLYDPRRFAHAIGELLNPGGIAVISTPYHGYLKNLALAVAGKMDSHHGPLWVGGHIKFWSRNSLKELFAEVGMEEIKFTRVGRIPPLAKSMVATYRRT